MKHNMNFKAVTIFSIMMAITLSVLACSNGNGKVNDSAKSEVATSETPAAPVVENEPTNDGISFLDEQKKAVALNDLKGKVVFINFWATWCPPCVREMPSINNLKKHYKNNKDLVFLMVDVDGNYDVSKKFMEKNNLDLPLYMPNGEIPSRFLGNSIPTTVILDKTGKMVARIEGGRDYMAPEIISSMDDLLEK
ncbi:TlpA disulfide reductase family protein [Pedobacter sp. ASV1-7]